MQTKLKRVKTAERPFPKVTKIPTGISGFDEVLEGGLPEGRSTLVIGGAGTGKTVLINEFVYRGITQYGQKAVFVTAEEHPEEIIRNVGGFGWDYTKFIRDKKLSFVDLTPVNEILQMDGTDYDCTVIVERVKHAIKKTGATRVAIDSIDSLISRLSNSSAVRVALNQLYNELRALGVTTVITAENIGTDKTQTRFGVEEFIADNAIELRLFDGQAQFVRKLFVRKLRGTGYRSGIVEYDITDKGFQVFPKIPVYGQFKASNFKTRIKTGVPGLDRLMGDGIPQGHMILVSGNSGTGKTTLGMQFLNQGVEQNQAGLWVALEEPIEQVNKTAEAHGWDFEKYAKARKIQFINESLIDLKLDALLYRIVNVVRDFKIKRVVVDSISSLMSASTNPEQVRQFLIQITKFFKQEGVTAILNYLSSATFGAVQGQLLSGLATNEMRLSSVCDGIILLLYVERDQCVKTLLNVLKMRGIGHDRQIYEMHMGKTGIVLGEKFQS